jgi:chemotaxis protein CheD
MYSRGGVIVGAQHLHGMPEPRTVSIGEFQLATAPQRLAIYGLGSCVAVLLHDAGARLSCLGHILLPERRADERHRPPGRFASTAVPAMLEALCRHGARRNRVLAKVAGGAQMFQYERPPDPRSVGNRNLEATLTALQGLAIRVDAEDTGGTHGRTVLVDAGSGRMEVRALRVTVKVL